MTLIFFAVYTLIKKILGKARARKTIRKKAQICFLGTLYDLIDFILRVGLIDQIQLLNRSYDHF